jgi:hypothetical protein
MHYCAFLIEKFIIQNLKTHASKSLNGMRKRNFVFTVLLLHFFQLTFWISSQRHVYSSVQSVARTFRRSGHLWFLGRLPFHSGSIFHLS